MQGVSNSRLSCYRICTHQRVINAIFFFVVWTRGHGIVVAS